MRSFSYSATTLLASLVTGSLVVAELLCCPLVEPAFSQEAASTNLLPTGTVVHPAEASLKGMRDIVNRLRSAVLAVINDVEQRDMAVVGEPMLIQPIPMADDTHAIGWAQKMEDLGPAMPPRKKWLDIDVSNIGELLDLLQSDAATIELPSDKQEQINESWGNFNAVIADMQTHYQSLKELTKGPQYDNLAIGKQALKIYDDASRMEKPWKQLVKLVKGKS